MSVRRHFSLQLVLISMTLLCQLNARTNLRIAVLDFQNLTGRAEMNFLEKAIPQILITDLMLCDEITIVERARMQDVLDEMQLALSGMIDEETAVEIGAMAGANTILVGSITVGGDVYRIDSRLVNVATGEVLLAEKKDWLSEDEIIRATDELAEAIIRQLTGEYVSVSSDFEIEPPPYFEDHVLTMETAIDKPVWLNGSAEPVYLQVDIYSKEIPLRERLPLNIALVIDRSGSMAREKKLDYAKQAAEFVVRNLDSDDILSLVTYESRVQVVLPSQNIHNKRQILKIIKGITSGGSTNLSGGMLEGYSQVARYLQTGQVNRVLLLSDGLANQGITQTGKLREICREKTAKGMSISTFGVGADYDEDLMQTLAEYGKGNYYLIGSPEQIPRIFTGEMSGLLAVAAQNVLIAIETAPGVLVEKVFGFPANAQNNRTEVALGDVFSNDHFKVTFQLNLPKSIGDSLQLAKVSMSYDDVVNKGERVVTGSLIHIWGTSAPEEQNDYFNPYVGENISLLSSTQQIQSAIQMIEEGNVESARKELGKQMTHVSNSVQKYKSTALKKQLLTLHRYSYSLENIDRKPEDEIRVMQKAAKYDLYQVGRGKKPKPAEQIWLEKPISRDTTDFQNKEEKIIREPVKPRKTPQNSSDIRYRRKVEPPEKKSAPSSDSKPVISPKPKPSKPVLIPRKSGKKKSVKSIKPKKSPEEKPEKTDKPVSKPDDEQTTGKKPTVKDKDNK